HGESSSFFVAAIAISMSLLIKITSIVILAPILYLALAAVYDRRQNNERRFPESQGRSGDRRSFDYGVSRAPLEWLIFFTGLALVTLCDLVLVRPSNCTKILSPSPLRRRRDSSREFYMVLAHWATDSDIQSHAASLTRGARRLACPALAGAK